MALSPKQKSFLRGKAHHLQPIVMLGKEGLTEPVLMALYKALRSHELVKVKIPAEGQDQFQDMVSKILEHCTAHKVQTIGHLLVLFRQSTPPGKMSKALKESGMPYNDDVKDDDRDSSGEEE